MKEKRQFPIFNSHLDLAHQYWKRLLHDQDWAIDATCGNGHDTLFLSQICAGVIGIDIQETAIKNTQNLLTEHNVSNFYLFFQSHQNFPQIAFENPIRLIVYNLGYLPGGQKTLTTVVDSTIESVKNGLDLIMPGGCISITCYPGHPEGKREEARLKSFLATLDSHKWSVCFHEWSNRNQSPSLFIIQKNLFLHL